jgi:hypothetical protein
MNDLEQYVKISTSTEGDCLVEVCFIGSERSMYEYDRIVKDLIDKGYSVANFKANEIKATNDNTKFQPTVTVKGRGSQVVETYISEMRKMIHE